MSTDTSPTAAFRHWTGRCVPALLAAAAWWFFAAYDRYPLAAAEGRLLGWQVLTVLLAVGLTARSWRWPAASAGLLGLLAWVLPPTPWRGVATGVALVAILLAAAWRCWSRRAGTPAGWRLATWAIALQALARPELLLQPIDARAVALALVVPVLSAGAVVILTRRLPERLALGAGLVMLLAPGFTVQTTLLLVALAAATIAADARIATWQRLIWLGVTLLPLARGPLGVVAVAAALALFGWLGGWRGKPGVRAPLSIAAATAVVVGLWVGAPSGQPLEALWLMLAIMPAAVATAGRERALACAGILLVVAGAWLGAELDGAAAGLALLALAPSLPRDRPLTRLQVGYGLGLAAVVLVAAAYPWMRAAPVAHLPSWLGIETWIWTAAAVAIAGLQEIWPTRRWVPALAAAGAVGLLLHALPSPGRRVVLAEPFSLTTGNTRWQADLPPTRTGWSRVAIDSQLFHGAELARGREIAQLIGRDAAGRKLFTLPLHAGDDSADWAALRADVRAQPHFHAPPAYLHAVAPDGSFFIPRFRAILAIPPGLPLAQLAIERADDLPAATEVALWRVEARP